MRYPRKVYAIQHNVTKRIYIGTSWDVEVRYRSHMSALRGNRHDNPNMQEDYNEYGEDYSLFLLDEIESPKENRKEFEYMKKYNTLTEEYGYNHRDINAKRSLFKKRIPYGTGTLESPLSKLAKQEIAEHYVLKINELLNECDDISLLDLIVKVLEKSI